MAFWICNLALPNLLRCSAQNAAKQWDPAEAMEQTWEPCKRDRGRIPFRAVRGGWGGDLLDSTAGGPCCGSKVQQPGGPGMKMVLGVSGRRV